MEKKKEYIKLWVSYEDYFEPLGDAEVGRLVRAMLQYKSTGTEPKFSGNERFIWPSIRRDLDESNDAYARVSEARRAAGQKGGVAKAGKAKQTVAIATKDKDKVKVKDKAEYTHFGVLAPLFSEYTSDPETLGLLDAWMENRAKKRAPNTDRAIRGNLDRMQQYAGESGMTVPDYLREIVRLGWQAFYPIRQNGSPQQLSAAASEIDAQFARVFGGEPHDGN